MVIARITIYLDAIVRHNPLDTQSEPMYESLANVSMRRYSLTFDKTLGYIFEDVPLFVRNVPHAQVAI